MAILDSAYRGDHYSKVTFIVRPLHIKLHFLHLYTLKIGLKLHVYALKIFWLSNANALCHISSRFSTTYFSTGGDGPLEIAYGYGVVSYIHAVWTIFPKCSFDAISDCNCGLGGVAMFPFLCTEVL